MPKRETYLHDRQYKEAFEHYLGAPPDQPAFELFVPKELATKGLLREVSRPIWEIESSLLWPRLCDEMVENRVRGDLVEFGVYRGGSLRKLVEIFSGRGVIDRFYGFDSFEGLPAADAGREHAMFASGSGFEDTSKETAWNWITKGLADPSNIELVKGWFSDTLPQYRDKINRVAFARVDCDMYRSTVDALDFIDGRLVEGAVVYLDDWTHDHTTGETLAFFEFAERVRGRYRFEKIATIANGALSVRVRVI